MIELLGRFAPTHEFAVQHRAEVFLDSLGA
jgi:hypothetical protein